MIDRRVAGVLLGLLGALAACDVTASSNGSSQSAAAQAGTCNPDRPLEALDRLLDAPIVPSKLFGGVDPAGGVWSGLALKDMERAFCDSDLITEAEEKVTAGWGTAPDYPVTVDYLKSTHRIDGFTVNRGYRGTLDFASRPSALGDPSKPNPYGQHRYSIGVGRPVLRDGATWELNWRKACADDRDTSCWQKQATEMFDALMYTFAPELPSTQDSCTRQLSCLARAITDGGEGVFGARPLGIYFAVNNADAPQPAPSTPDLIYGYTVKLTPFSSADTFLKLDDAGPEAVADNLGDRHSHCAFKLGMPFGSFMSDCIEVMADPSSDDVLLQKVLGGATRTVGTTGTAALTGTWNLDVTGLRPSFASERFDEQAPTAAARATALVLDLRSSGKVLNEYSADKSKLTLAGTAAVYREYARLTQEFLHAQMDAALPRFPLGDPACLLPAGGDAATWRPARGCTGMEQFITPAEASTSTDPGIQRLSVGPEHATQLGISTALRAATPTAVFCTDPGTFDHCNEGGGDSGVFGATRDHVVAVLGGGSASNLPEPIRDRKVYVRMFAKALVKYLRAASDHPTDLADPRFEALSPLDSEITIDSIQDDLVAVKYGSRFEYRVAYLTSLVDQLIFH
jgi:hypothetical protein